MAIDMNNAFGILELGSQISYEIAPFFLFHGAVLFLDVHLGGCVIYLLLIVLTVGVSD